MEDSDFSVKVQKQFDARKPQKSGADMEKERERIGGTCECSRVKLEDWMNLLKHISVTAHVHSQCFPVAANFFLLP